MSRKTPLHTLTRLSPVGALTAVLSDGAQRTLWWASANERGLWAAVVATAVADIVLTVHGLQLGLREMNPLVRRGLALAGIPALAVLKALALGIGVCCTRLLPDRHTGIVPLALLGPTVAAVTVNTILLGVVYLRLLF